MIFKRHGITSALLLAGVGFTGCAEDDEVVDELELSEPAEPGTPAGADELASADNGAQPYAGHPIVECSSHNVIGVLEPGFSSCSVGMVPGWSWHHMFVDFTPELQAWTETRPAGLMPFCIYEFAGDPTQEDYEALFDAIVAAPNMSIDSVAPDCRGQAVMGQGLGDPAVTSQLVAAFRAAVQRVPGGELDGDRQFAEVAIVDGVSQLAHDDPGVDPVNRHGEFMGDIVSDIACAEDNPDCEAAIRYYVAMPRDEFELADHDHGGEFGTYGDLAMSIVAAVGQWLQDRGNADAPQRLVINLSLGWAPGDTQTTTDPNRGPIRAFEEALYFVTCHGGLVLAAAGNRSDPGCDPSEVGPLAPATYEQVAVLTEAQCAARGYNAIDTGNYPVVGAPRPLVQAVGGLTGLDVPIANARIGGMPGLAAYASNVAVQDPVNGEITTPLTGTSAAAAVASGIAALIWAYRPDWTPSEVVEAMRNSAYVTNLDADFDFSGTTPKVRRLSACAAVMTACAGAPGLSCPAAACADPTPPADGYLGDYFDAVADALADPGNITGTFNFGNGVAPVCQVGTWDEKMDPQPEHPMCPECTIDSPPDGVPNNDTLSMTIESGYQGQVEGITLVTYDDYENSSTFVFGKEIVESVNNPNIDITRVTVEAPGTTAASLTFVLIDSSIQDGPISVNPSPPV